MNSRATKNTKSPSGDSPPAPKSIGGGGLGACIGRLGAFRSARFQPLRGSGESLGPELFVHSRYRAETLRMDAVTRAVAHPLLVEAPPMQ